MANVASELVSLGNPPRLRPVSSSDNDLNCKKRRKLKDETALDTVRGIQRPSSTSDSPLKSEVSPSMSELNHENETQPRKTVHSRSVFLLDTLPAVLETVRHIIDEKLPAQDNWKGMATRDIAKVCQSLKKPVLSEIVGMDVVSKQTDTIGKVYRGDSRFWGRLFYVAITLPSHGQAKAIFEAMRRYPSSTLTCRDLSAALGNNKPVDKASSNNLLLNLMSLFDSKCVKTVGPHHWFEREAFGRLQEMTVHITAITEYVLRCACSCYETTEPKSTFDQFILRIHQQCTYLERRDGRNTLCLNLPSISDLDVPCAHPCCESCLEAAATIAREAVQEGTRKAGRKHGCKRTKRSDTKRLGLEFLRKFPVEVVKELILGMSGVIAKRFGVLFDSPRFDDELVKLALKSNDLFKELGVTFYSLPPDDKETSGSDEATRSARLDVQIRLM